jgi:Sigma-70, region 4
VVRTALNAGASWWRRRVRELPLAGHDPVAPHDADDGLDAALLTALRHLPDRQREVITLRVFLDLDIDTIARHLGIAPRHRPGAPVQGCDHAAPRTFPFSGHGGRLMNDNEELKAGAVLSAVRDSMSGLRMPTAPRLDAITARGRGRRRRMGGLSIAGASACAALVAVAGLAGGSGGAAHAPVVSAGHAPQHQVLPAHLAAFSVVAGPGGTTTLTLYPGQVISPDAVRQALAEHDIAALVTASQFCRTADQPAPGVGDVVVISPRPNQVPTSGHPAGPTLTIYGSRIPSGVKLSIGYRQASQNREISFTLIVAGAPLTCATIPDNGPHGDD